MKKKSIHSYVEQAIANGSIHDYALAFSVRRHKKILRAMLCIRHELSCAAEQSDPSVTEIRRQWWLQDIARLRTQDCAHPVTQSLQSLIDEYPQKLQTLLDWTEHGCRQPSVGFSDLAHLRQHCQEYGGQFFRCFEQLSDKTHNVFSAEKMSALEHLGAAARLTEILQHAHANPKAHQYWLPKDLMETFSVNSEYLSFKPVPKRVRQLFACLGDEAIDSFNQCQDELKSLSRASRIYARLYRHLLRKIEKRNYCSANKTVRLKPSAKLWHAWRAAS